MSGATLKNQEQVTRVLANEALYRGNNSGGGGGGGGGFPQVSVLGSGQTTVDVVPNGYYIFDLDTVGGDVTFITTGITTKDQQFGIKQVGTNNGGYTFNVDSPSAGAHIELQGAAGTLGNSFAPGGTSANGTAIVFVSDGTNLWYGV
jgi:hypothetical protein